jgi:hypothetical protein
MNATSSADNCDIMSHNSDAMSHNAASDAARGGHLPMRLCERIALDLEGLRTVPYDHDLRGGLPARGDALLAATRTLCDPAGPTGGLAEGWEPAVILRGDGTIEVTFFAGSAALSLLFPGHDIVLLERHHADNATVVRGRAVTPADAELAAAFVWLIAQGVGVPP